MSFSSRLFNIDPNIANQLLTFALDSPKQEICGLISCDNDRQYCYPISNIALSPATHFEMDPKQLISTFKKIRELKQTLLAIYHSHPDGHIKPSTTDVQQHQYHKLLYLIISPGNDGVLNLGGYLIHEDQTVVPVALTALKQELS